MALTNHERVGKALELLKTGLLPFIERELKAKYGNGWAFEVKDILSDTALTHDRAKSDPFAGNPRFRRWGGQIGGGWRQVSAGWAGGVRSVKRVSIGGRRSGPIAVRGFPGTLNAAWNGSWGRPGQVTRVAGERVWREARASAQDRARGQRRNFG